MPDNFEKLNSFMAKKKSPADLNLALLFSRFSCVDAIVGADYEVTDENGDLLAHIRRKPLAPEQVAELMKVLEAIIKFESKNSKRNPK